MIASPTIFQPVQIWYAARWRPLTTLHGKVGVEYVVPCGNLRRPQHGS